MARVRVTGHSGSLVIKFEFKIGETPDLSAYADPTKEVSSEYNIWNFRKIKHRITMLPKKCFDIAKLAEKDRKKAID